MSGYSTQEVADLIGLKPNQVRHYVRRELLRPERGQRGEYRFTFQDVVMLRTAKGLLDSAVTPRRAHRVLAKLKNDMDGARSLASMRIYADGPQVMVRQGSDIWEIESGQGHLDFVAPQIGQENVASLAEVSPVRTSPGRDPEDLGSDDWYNLGLDLEEMDAEKAPDAYRQAIRLDPKNADAHVNLGRLYQMQTDLKRAKRHYELALTILPDHPLANYNLGTVFDELDELEAARRFYEKAEGIPDAHYNLARICEIHGDEVSALRHMRTYRDLVDRQGGEG